ncbi:response regulator [Oceanospirillum linum]|uniref:DNA-binding response regulator n=1 Tax=Oceanospirillum linum TaxID=966 RepID=A0A1T1HD28_OCELI|nr:response regulator transcription factor [Oceanospirillum linum]OOV87627.1 DNA-binding response regulator [Oceanospirillum linum]SEF94251.1 DNA-binding response regulator, NarL/FixJ family, contains REC and HTH domains [Oleiphilus messinensis]SMP11924.1 two component transcriptional regulator, LuxR family [Oceanospirillum linum]
MINVLIVDDQTLLREGLKSLLALKKNIQVVAEAVNGQEALAILEDKSRNIDVVMLDIRMPILDGIGVLKAMREQHMQQAVLVLTTFDDTEQAMECIRQGAKGYALKDINLERLTCAIEALAKGGTALSPGITDRILTTPPKKNDFYEPVIETLTEGELKVLSLIAAGYSNIEIAAALHRSEGTIRNQVSFILRKLDVRDRTRAVLKAIDLGLL